MSQKVKILVFSVLILFSGCSYPQIEYTTWDSCSVYADTQTSYIRHPENLSCKQIDFVLTNSFYGERIDSYTYPDNFSSVEKDCFMELEKRFVIPNEAYAMEYMERCFDE